jgi:hypothetical protein
MLNLVTMAYNDQAVARVRQLSVAIIIISAIVWQQHINGKAKRAISKKALSE